MFRIGSWKFYLESNFMHYMYYYIINYVYCVSVIALKYTSCNLQWAQSQSPFDTNYC